MNVAWSTLGTTFLFSLVLTAVLRSIGLRFGWVDHPGGRKTHRLPTPFLGGIAIYLAFLLTVGWQLVPQGLSPTHHILLFAGALIVMMGAIDDVWRLSVKLRFGVQIAVALLAVHFGGARIVELGDLIGLGLMDLGVLAVPFSVFALVGTINAVNLSDGMDGLAGSLCVISLILLAIVAVSEGRAIEAALLLALVGGVAGFLVFNLRYSPLGQARIFLGDSGSNFLGLVIGYFLIVSTQGEGRTMAPVTALWILGAPLLDTIACMTMRIREGLSPFRPDRRHIHHLLLDSGLTIPRTLLLIVMLHATLGVAGLLGQYMGVPEYVMFFLFMALFVLYLIGLIRYRGPSSC